LLETGGCKGAGTAGAQAAAAAALRSVDHGALSDSRALAAECCLTWLAAAADGSSNDEDCSP